MASAHIVNSPDVELDDVMMDATVGSRSTDHVTGSPTKPGEGNGHVDAIESDESGSDNGYGVVYHPPNKLAAVMNRIVPHGGWLSNSYNLSAVTLGSGIIVLPSAFQETGVITSVLVLVAITLSTVYSMYILAQAIEKSGRRLCSYEALSRGLLGRGWDYLAAFHMWMFCFGSCVSYVISTGDLLYAATNDPSVNSFIRSTWGNRVLVIIIWLVAMLPLTIPKEINSLRYASVFGVTCMMYFVVVIVVHCCLNGFHDGKPIHKMAMFKGGNDAVVGFSMFIFAFLAQTNGCRIYVESRKPSPAHIARDTGISMTACCVLYILAGIFGYLDFGEAITGSILRFYDVRSDVMVAISYVGIGVKMCVGFAICMQPSRDAVYYCLGDFWPMFKDLKTVPFWLNAVICSFMSVVALVLGLFIPNVSVVFSLVGSFCGGFLGFIFPALFIMYAGNWGLRQVGWFNWLSTYALLIAGVIAVVFGTVAAIYGEV